MDVCSSNLRSAAASNHSGDGTEATARAAEAARMVRPEMTAPEDAAERRGAPPVLVYPAAKLPAYDQALYAGGARRDDGALRV